MQVSKAWVLTRAGVTESRLDTGIIPQGPASKPKCAKHSHNSKTCSVETHRYLEIIDEVAYMRA